MKKLVKSSKISYSNSINSSHSSNNNRSSSSTTTNSFITASKLKEIQFHSEKTENWADQSEGFQKNEHFHRTEKRRNETLNEQLNEDLDKRVNEVWDEQQDEEKPPSKVARLNPSEIRLRVTTSYRYTALKDLKVGETVNVYGVVTEWTPLKKSLKGEGGKKKTKYSYLKCENE